MANDGPIQNYDVQEHAHWTSRPALARALRFVVLLLPIAGSFSITWMASRYFPPEELGINTWLWWLAVIILATAVMFGIERLARRALPLVALLKMNLVFPEEAPSRFSTALRTGTTKQLERRIEEMRLLGLHDSDEVNYGQQMLELIAALNAHDRLTRGHCERVRAYTDMIIEELKIEEDDANKLRWSALLHDVGKIMVPASIINKDGRPDDQEWEILKRHAAEGQRMVAPIAAWLGDWSRAVGEHHERWDGDGYPNGFAANEIHLGARIVAVADAFDVMTSARSYKKPMPTEAAREELLRCSGSQFDPEVVRAFLNIGIGRLRLAMGPLTWLANIPSAGQIPLVPAATPVASVVASAAGATAAVLTGGIGGILVPEDNSVPEPTAAFADTAPVETTIPLSITTTIPQVTIPVVSVTSAPITTTTTSTTTVPPTTSTTAAPAASPVTTAPTTTTTTTTTVAPAPVGNDSTIQSNEDEPLTVSLSGVSSAGSPTFEIVAQPQHGTLTLISATGAGTAGEELWSYVPDPSYNGPDEFRYQICDSRGTCDLATVTIIVAAQNDAPVALDDAFRTKEDDALSIPLTDLVGNDTDVESAPALDSFTQPVNGTVTTSITGDLVYTPDPNFNGTDTFTYTITDDDPGNPLADTATVTVTVRSVNDQPLAGNDSFATTEDALVAIPRSVLLANDSDVESTPTIESFTQPANGSISTGLTGALVYTPHNNFHGTDTFTYTITDNHPRNPLTSTATVTITVSPLNDRPAALDDITAGVEDETLNIGIVDLLSNDSDTETTPALASYTQPANGTVTTSITGDLLYTPNANFDGTDTFTYTITDDGAPLGAPNALTDTATVTITISPVNDKPVAVADSFTTDEDIARSILIADLLGNDIDIETPPSFDSYTQPANGTVTTSITGDLLYTPNADFNGTDTFTYTITDDDAGNPLTSTATVTINVGGINDLPVANPDTGSTIEDTPVTLLVGDLLANDADTESAPTLDSYTQPADGTVTTSITGDLVYTPNANFNGTDTFTYTITDGAAFDTTSVTITVAPVNDPPVAVDDAATTNEDVALTIELADLFANDSDTETTPALASYTQPANGIITTSITGDLLYTPNANFNGTDTFTYTITDNGAPLGAPNALTDTATLTITVVAVNDRPEGTNDTGYTVDQGVVLSIPIVDLLANDTDPENSPLNIASIASPVDGTAAWSADGLSIEFTSDPNFVGQTNFSYNVCDFAGLCDLDDTKVIIDVTNVNDAPVGLPDFYTMSEDDVLSIPWSGPGGLLTNDDDPDLLYNDELRVDWTGTSADGSVVLDPANETVTFSPNANFAGTAIFTYVVCDLANACATPTKVTVTVLDQPDDPIAVDDAFVPGGRWNVAQGEDLTISVADIRANDSDPDDPNNANGGSLTYTLPTATTTTTNGSSINQAGPGAGFVISTDAGYHGVDSFEYEVCNLSGRCDTALVTINVTDVNHPPSITLATPHDNTLAFVGAEATDWTDIVPAVQDAIDAQTGDTHVWSISSGTLPAGLTLDTQTGVISGQPALGSSGVYSVNLEVNDQSTVAPTMLTDSISLQFEIVDWQISDLDGDWLISEVRYRETAPNAPAAMFESWRDGTINPVGALDEFIEVVNVSGGPLDISELTFTDINLKSLNAFGQPIPDVLALPNPTPGGAGISTAVDFEFTPPSTIIANGEHVTIWLSLNQLTNVNVQVDPAEGVLFTYQVPVHQRRASSKSFCVCAGFPLLGNQADEVFVIDSSGRLVDFVAWDDQSGIGFESSDYPTDVDPAIAPNVPAGAAPGTSASLADYDESSGMVFSPYACWEHTGSGAATCAGATPTEAWTPNPPFESYGEPNYPGAP